MKARYREPQKQVGRAKYQVFFFFSLQYSVATAVGLQMEWDVRSNRFPDKCNYQECWARPPVHFPFPYVPTKTLGVALVPFILFPRSVSAVAHSQIPLPSSVICFYEPTEIRSCSNHNMLVRQFAPLLPLLPCDRNFSREQGEEAHAVQPTLRERGDRRGRKAPGPQLQRRQGLRRPKRLSSPRASAVGSAQPCCHMLPVAGDGSTTS